MDAIIRSISIVRSRRALAGLACLLICIRVLAVGICSTCFNEFDAPASRVFYLHDGSDHDACHHGREPVSPLVAWACEVTQDDADFVLPDSPLLPIIVSFLVPLTLLGISRRDSLLLAGKGRSPPLQSLLS